MANSCTPRNRWAEREAARERRASERDQRRTQHLAEAERESLEDPDRPRVIRPGTLPEQITVRIVYSPPGVIIAETSPDKADQTSWKMTADDPETAMAGAEVALAALGYTLDRFRMYQDIELMVGTFYLREGPYA